MDQTTENLVEKDTEINNITNGINNMSLGRHEGADPFTFISNERLAEFDEAMTKNKICLLRSPSGSGKTTLAKKLETLSCAKKNRVVVRITMSWFKHSKELNCPETFDAFWIKHSKQDKRPAEKSWTDCINCDVQTDVII